MAMRNKTIIHAIDCDHFGELYAARLLRNSQARVEDLPELLAFDDFKLLATYMKLEVFKYVRRCAKDILKQNGYPPELVDRLLPH